MTMVEKAARGRPPRVALVGIGVVFVVAGLLALAWPGATLAVVALCFGVATLVTGLMALVDAVAGDGPPGRGISAVVGVLGIVVGLVALRAPAGTLLVLTLVAGVWLVVFGLISLLVAGVHTGWRLATAIVVGIVDILVGIVIVSAPAIGLSTLALLIGIALVVRGIGFLVTGARRPGEAPPAPESPATDDASPRTNGVTAMTPASDRSPRQPA